MQKNNSLLRHLCTKKMDWILLIIAGCFEVAFAASLQKAKEANGAQAWWWYTSFLLCLSVSMILLVRVVRTIPIGTAYAVWTGIGAVGTVLVGIWWFNEPAGLWRMFFLTTLIGSVIGLKMVSH